MLRLLSLGDTCLRWSWRHLSRADGRGWPSPDLVLVSGAQLSVKPVRETSKQKVHRADLEMTEAENNAAAAETVRLPEGFQTYWWTGSVALSHVLQRETALPPTSRALIFPPSDSRNEGRDFVA